MGRLPSLLVFGVLLALTSGETVLTEQEVSVPKVEPLPPITIMPIPSTSTESPTPPTTKPTPPPTTAPTKPTTAPTKPTTPPTKPTTAPTKPTPPITTSAPPTTPAPTKPTPPPPTPAPPKPPANIDPPTGDWRINYTKPQNGSCIFAQMAIQIEVPYYTKENKTWHAYVDVPKNANATGNCANSQENLKLTWGNNSVEFDFTAKVNGTWYAVDKVNVNLYMDEKNFPNMNSSKTISLVYGKSLFNTTDKMSYKCAKMQTMNLTMDNQNPTLGYLHIGHLQLQAFSVDNSTGFASAVDCEPSGTPDIVPIAAGCALAALIIIVLGAYLIGRKRSQARGYLSM